MWRRFVCAVEVLFLILSMSLIVSGLAATTTTEILLSLSPGIMWLFLFVIGYKPMVLRITEDGEEL